MSKIILASASPRRSELLRGAGVDFEVCVASVAEVSGGGALSAEGVCEENARLKASAVAALRPDRWVLGADTLVCLNGECFGKPRDEADAFEMLSRLQGRVHEVITGVALCNRSLKEETVFHVVTQVVFRKMSAEEIRHYMGLVHTLDKAGAYGIQEHGDLIVEATEGAFSNVIGLPVDEVCVLLKTKGLI